jgi:hypothetical protein
MQKLSTYSLPTKSIPVPNHGKCPFGHPWVYVTRKMGWCSDDMCRVAFITIGSRSQKVYFDLEGLQAIIEGDVTTEEIIEREKLADGNSRC